ncbi:MAG TPA: VanZ family protein [Lachnospiraceae bacterium]|nr:VanZ family protein [Lachnospiraceae bacterium]
MKKIRKYLWFVPAIVWMIVIFQFSGQVGTVSSGVSLKVTEGIVTVIEKFRQGDEADEENLVTRLHPYVRKAAHMTEYAVLFVLLFLSFIFSTVATRSAAISIVISFVYSCSDEIHQRFVSNRSGQWTDVCIDMTGVLFAVALVLFIYSGWQLRKGRKKL